MNATDKKVVRQLLADAAAYATDARNLLKRRDADEWPIDLKIKAAMQDLGQALAIVTGDEWWEGEE